MKHLFSHSVYRDYENAPLTDDVISSLKGVRADGIELLTGYFDVDRELGEVSPGVHLPYATDWFSAWNGTHDASWMTDDESKFIHYGKDRDQIKRNITDAIRYASAVSPEYGVFHAGSVHLDDVYSKKFRYDDISVLKSLAEMMNSVVSEFKGNEPPFTILFENLWWPGLKLLDDREFSSLADRLEFDNWGFCLDTGHMMNALGTCYEENESISQLLNVFEGYSDELIDRVRTMHLQLSTSAEYTTSEYPEIDMTLTPKERLSKAYGHVSKIDQHRPFTSKRCTELVEYISPDFVTHELSALEWDERLFLFASQRSFFPLC